VLVFFTGTCSLEHVVRTLKKKRRLLIAIIGTARS
jgi:hypothetical protein